MTNALFFLFFIFNVSLCFRAEARKEILSLDFGGLYVDHPDIRHLIDQDRYRSIAVTDPITSQTINLLDRNAQKIADSESVINTDELREEIKRMHLGAINSWRYSVNLDPKVASALFQNVDEVRRSKKNHNSMIHGALLVHPTHVAGLALENSLSKGSIVAFPLESGFERKKVGGLSDDLSYSLQVFRTERANRKILIQASKIIQRLSIPVVLIAFNPESVAYLPRSTSLWRFLPNRLLASFFTRRALNGYFRSLERLADDNPNTLFVTVAGNHGQTVTGRQAAFFSRSNVLAVAGSMKNELPHFTNTSSAVIPIAAPAVSVLGPACTGGRMALSGTCMSAPQVAGRAAWVKELFPHSSPSAIKDYLFKYFTESWPALSEKVQEGRIFRTCSTVLEPS